MRHQEPLDDWEKALHRELDALPELDAPSSLIAGVMKQINTPATPAWYHTSWWQWPLAMRTTSVSVKTSRRSSSRHSHAPTPVR